MGLGTKALIRLFTVMMMVGCIAQCSGEEGPSSKVKFVSNTKEPLVVTADRTITVGGEQVTIKAPWFIWQYSFTNTSTQNLNVVTVIFNVSYRKNGIVVKKKIAIDPNYSCTGDVTRELLAFVAPGETFSGIVGTAGSVGCDIYNDTHLTPPNYEGWYIQDLGVSDNGIYTLDLEATGWFSKVSDGEITDRFTSYDYLITR